MEYEITSPIKCFRYFHDLAGNYIDEVVSENEKSNEMFVCDWIDPELVVPCRIYFGSDVNLANHLLEDHFDDSWDALFYCYWGECHNAKKEFDNKCDLIQHINSHIKQSKQRSEKPTYTYDVEQSEVGDVCESQLKISDIAIKMKYAILGHSQLRYINIKDIPLTNSCDIGGLIIWYKYHFV